MLKTLNSFLKIGSSLTTSRQHCIWSGSQLNRERKKNKRRNKTDIIGSEDYLNGKSEAPQTNYCNQCV